MMKDQHVAFHERLQKLRKSLVDETLPQLEFGGVPVNNLVAIGVVEAAMIISKAFLETQYAQQQSPAHPNHLDPNPTRRPAEE